MSVNANTRSFNDDPRSRHEPNRYCSFCPIGVVLETRGMVSGSLSAIADTGMGGISTVRGLLRRARRQAGERLTQLKGSYDLQVMSTRARHYGKLEFRSLFTPYERPVPSISASRGISAGTPTPPLP
jgi:hypothetical protein